jgi:hypothetical protein
LAPARSDGSLVDVILLRTVTLEHWGEALPPLAQWFEAYMVQGKVRNGRGEGTETSGTSGMSGAAAPAPATAWMWPRIKCSRLHRTADDVREDVDFVLQTFSKREWRVARSEVRVVAVDVCPDRYVSTVVAVLQRPPVTVKGMSGLRPSPLPRSMWVVESELATSAAMGHPATNGVCGVRVCRRALNIWDTMVPLRYAFATTAPPLVLYHGTSDTAAAGIVRDGLKVSPESGVAMAGPGVYLARWDKASDFARRDADGNLRPVPGVVLRVVLAMPPGALYTLQATDICSCACARPYVDHGGRCPGAAGAVVVAVPDGAVGATRRAEWCVRDPRYLAVLTATTSLEDVC